MPAGREHEIAPFRGPGEAENTIVVVGELARSAARSQIGRQLHKKDPVAPHGACPQKRELPSAGRHEWTVVVRPGFRSFGEAAPLRAID